MSLAPVIETACPIRDTTPLRMTFEQFLEWGDETTWAEWVDGEVILVPTSTKHQRLLMFLLKVLVSYVEEFGLGEVFPPPYVMRLPSRPSGREPDLLFIASENLHRLQEKFLDGPADLVVEIISEDGQTRDRVSKFAEYQTAGVREYWLIDPLHRRADFYVLDERGRLQLAEVAEAGQYHSTVLAGLWLDLGWLWQEPHPALREVRQAWGWA
jgi:Uma2 family endonuclease